MLGILRALLMAITILLPPSLSAAGNKVPTTKQAVKHGFQSLAFGAGFSDAIAYVDERFPGYDMKNWTDGTSALHIKNFKLGDHSVSVLLNFDFNDKFYSFTFFLPLRSLNDSDTLTGDMRFLMRVFTEKYGAALKCEQLNKDGFNVCEWANKDLGVLVTVLESAERYKYSATGIVSMKRLERAFFSEKENRERKEQGENEQRKQRVEKEAASRF